MVNPGKLPVILPSPTHWSVSAHYVPSHRTGFGFQGLDPTATQRFSQLGAHARISLFLVDTLADNPF